MKEGGQSEYYTCGCQEGEAPSTSSSPPVSRWHPLQLSLCVLSYYHVEEQAITASTAAEWPGWGSGRGGGRGRAKGRCGWG